MLNLKTLAAAATFAVGLGGAAHALTLLPPDDGPYCSTSQFTVSTDCEGAYGGNDANQSLDGLFGEDDWFEIFKVDASSGTDGILTVTAAVDQKSGTWSVTGWDGFTKVMAVLKGGSSFSAYLVDLSVTSGTWNTLGLAKGNGDPAPGLSHFTLYSTVAPIPLPAAGFLMLGALGALGVAARRRKA